MLKPIDNYFNQQQEPVKSCLLAMRQLILAYDSHLTEQWKYGMPFYCYNNKMFCYLWVHKKLGHPYLGIVPGSIIKGDDLIQEKRARMKILLIDTSKDIPIKRVKEILSQMIKFYKEHSNT